MAFDTDKYDLKWELTASEALSVLTGVNHGFKHEVVQFEEIKMPPKPLSAAVPSIGMPSPIIFDLRAANDFENSHIPNALSTPLQSLHATTPSPLADFTETGVLRQQWTNLKPKFSGQDPEIEEILARQLPITAIIVLCYKGETSRIASAVLRTRGLEAFSIKGGMQVEQTLIPNGHPKPLRQEAGDHLATALRVLIKRPQKEDGYSTPLLCVEVRHTAPWTSNLCFILRRLIPVSCVSASRVPSIFRVSSVLSVSSQFKFSHANDRKKMCIRAESLSISSQ